MGRGLSAHSPVDARGPPGGRSLLARTGTRRKSTRRWAGFDRDRVDARYRAADARRTQGHPAYLICAERFTREKAWQIVSTFVKDTLERSSRFGGPSRHCVATACRFDRAGLRAP